MEKNVIIVDEQGNECGATYPKRAKGLVKNGRARFITENKICLACPPESNLEDSTMEKTEAITAREILAELQAIRTDRDYIFAALSTLEKIPTSSEKVAHSPDDVAGQAKAEAIQSIVLSRETTNQQLIRLYQMMYEDTKPRVQLSEDKED